MGSGLMHGALFCNVVTFDKHMTGGSDFIASDVSCGKSFFIGSFVINNRWDELCL